MAKKAQAKPAPRIRGEDVFEYWRGLLARKKPRLRFLLVLRSELEAAVAWYDAAHGKRRTPGL